MSQYFALFQIGPVQEFIQTARKTQDFWSGSFLLSFLNGRAIAAFGKDEVIFPNVEGNFIYEGATKLMIPWESTQEDRFYIPSLPNRFFSITEELPKSRLEMAKKAVISTWEEISNKVMDHLKEKIKGINQGFWNDQVNNRSFEILYVWRPRKDGETDQEAYQKTEELLGLRKMSRFFTPQSDPQGSVCSLCGLRIAFSPEGCRNRQDLRNWWKTEVRKHEYSYRFREGEFLCAVCTVKRLAPQLVFKAPLDIPSTSTMAAASFQRQIRNFVHAAENQIKNDLKMCCSALKTEVREAAKAIGEPEQARLPPYFNQVSICELDIEGDWFFDSFYEHSERKGKIEKAHKALKKLVSKLKEYGSLKSPSKYFALLNVDGDNMGNILSQLTNDQAHEFSQILATFSIESAPAIVEKQFAGYILYWGGDEGVAMLCLEDLIGAMEALRETWRAEVEKKLNQMGITQASLSMGAVIAHHQSPLRMIIREMYSASKKAKELRKEKDAWAVNILKRSGAPVLAQAGFSYGDFQPLLLLNHFITAYQEEWLFPRWLADLRNEQTILGDSESLKGNAKKEWWKEAKRLFDLEVERLISHHKNRKDNRFQKEVAKLIEDLKTLNEKISGSYGTENYQRHHDISALMDLAHYIAKGGGK